jgi:hypothetical protein
MDGPDAAPSVVDRSRPVPSFCDWLAQRGDLASQPWLILGKGPSLQKHRTFDLRPFCTLGLNHVSRELPVTVAHVIDLDVIDQCGAAIEQNAGVLVMPWFPHTTSGPMARWVTGHPARLSQENLAQVAERHPVLRRLNDQQRLLWYNLSTARTAREGSPIIPVKYFSAEAALNLLAAAGVRRVRSLGVDGGRAYSPEFGDLRGRTLLANGRLSFDAQFEEIARTLTRTRISYAPLDVESPVRVYVAATEQQMLPVRVLEYSIRAHASMDVEVFPLCRAGIPIPVPRTPAQRPRTPFSFQRFLIPSLAGFKGRALYLDSDMLVFKDVARLWTMPFGDADVLAVRAADGTTRRPQFSVMLLDCDRLTWDIERIVADLDRGTLDYDALMYELSIASRVRADIPADWNSLETFDPARTALLHYTDMPMQPWVSTANPLGYLWTRVLIDAIAAGFLSRAEVAGEVAAGNVRPSLLFQIDHQIEDNLLLPRHALEGDRAFAPAWASRGHPTRRWRRPLRTAAAVAGRLAGFVRLQKLHERVRARIIR